MLERYGEAIDADLTLRGLDLAAEWKSRRWRRLLNLIDHLPRDSYYVEAQFDDEELAKLILSGPQTPPRRRMSEWTPEVEALAVLVDRITEGIRWIVTHHGGTPGEAQPYLRPTTAAERTRARQRVEQHRSLVARVLPAQEEDA